MTTPTNLANIYTAGLNNVGSYQVSGMPFCSGGIDLTAAGVGVKIEFPYVTSWVQIIHMNTLDPTKRNRGIYVAMSQNALGTENSFMISGYEGGFGCPMSDVLPLKTTELWLSGAGETGQEQATAYVVAGLTYIPTNQITAISPSGPNWSGSIGVG